MKDKAIEVSIDVGHMFTGGIFLNNGSMHHVKIPNTGPLHEQIVHCLHKGADRMKMSFNELISSVSILRYMSSVADTILDTKSGQKVALIVTKGHEKTLYAAKESVRGVLFPEELILGVDEEVDASGKVIQSIDEGEFLKGLKNLLEWGTQRIAICLKNSYRNPANEKAIKRLILESVSQFYLGGVDALCSHEISTALDDGVRLNTAVFNSYFHERLARTYRKTNDVLRTSGLKSTPMIKVPSGGNVWTPVAIAIDSYFGPAASLLAGAAEIGGFYGIDDLVVAEVGASKCRVGIVKKGEYRLDSRPAIWGFPVDVPSPEFHSLSLGTASIAKVDSKGKVRVDADKTGTDPGPACFNRGGTDPTVMDADLVLGYINAGSLCCGEISLDVKKARQAIKDKIADKAGVSIEEAANQIRKAFDAEIGKEISNYLAAKECKAEKSILLAVGGAGPAHCIGYAQNAGFRMILTLKYGAQFAAFGQSVEGIVLKSSIPFYSVLCKSDGNECSIEYDQFNNNVSQMIRRINEIMKRNRGYRQDRIKIGLDLTMRCQDGEEKILKTGFSSIHSKNDIKQICDDFRAKYPSKKKGIELIAVTVKGEIESDRGSKYPESEIAHGVPRIGPIWDADPKELARFAKKVDKKAVKENRKVFWKDKFDDTVVFDRKALVGGNIVTGPAIVEQEDSTWVIPEGYHLLIDSYLNGVITKESK
jgi:N-methylhydantoinase A/acetophenone carboxylase